MALNFTLLYICKPIKLASHVFKWVGVVNKKWKLQLHLLRQVKVKTCELPLQMAANWFHDLGYTSTPVFIIFIYNIAMSRTRTWTHDAASPQPLVEERFSVFKRIAGLYGETTRDGLDSYLHVGKGWLRSYQKRGWPAVFPIFAQWRTGTQMLLSMCSSIRRELGS